MPSPPSRSGASAWPWAQEAPTTPTTEAPAAGTPAPGAQAPAAADDCSERGGRAGGTGDGAATGGTTADQVDL